MKYVIGSSVTVNNPGCYDLPAGEVDCYITDFDSIDNTYRCVIKSVAASGAGTMEWDWVSEGDI